MPPTKTNNKPTGKKVDDAKPSKGAAAPKTPGKAEAAEKGKKPVGEAPAEPVRLVDHKRLGRSLALQAGPPPAL